MALQPEALFGTAITQRINLRAYPYEDGIRPGRLASFGAAANLEHLTPLFFDDTANLWKVWAGEGSEVNTLSAHAATPATAGTFTLTVDGVTTAAIAFDATAAIVQAALEALSNVAPGDVTAVATTGADLGEASAVITLNWGGNFAGENVTITADQALISAGSDFVLATDPQGGVAAADGSAIDGFLWTPEAAHAVSTVGEQLVQVFRAGLIHAADIPVPTGESRADLNDALLTSDLRQKNIELQGLVGIH